MDSGDRSNPEDLGLNMDSAPASSATTRPPLSLRCKISFKD